MPSIPQKLRDSAIGLLNTGMTMNAVAMNTGYSTRAIRHLRERFQATGRTEDRPCRGLPVIEVMAGFEYIVGEINVMPTSAYLNEIVLGVGVLSWSWRVLHMAFALILSLLKRI